MRDKLSSTNANSAPDSNLTAADTIQDPVVTCANFDAATFMRLAAANSNCVAADRNLKAAIGNFDVANGNSNWANRNFNAANDVPKRRSTLEETNETMVDLISSANSDHSPRYEGQGDLALVCVLCGVCDCVYNCVCKKAHGC